MARFLRSVLCIVLAVVALAGCLGDAPSPNAPIGTVDDGQFVHDSSGMVPSLKGTPLGPAFRSLDHRALEPTLGVTSDGAIFYAAMDDVVAASREAKVLRSTDRGETWRDVSPRFGVGSMQFGHVPPETSDPFLYVDPTTDRVFQLAMYPTLTCAWLSWSDDGGLSWQTNPRGCQNAPSYDHQSMAAGKPRTVQTQGYPNVLIQCANQATYIGCARSLDGGPVWTPLPPILIANADCPAFHGFPAAAPDGTLFLPRNDCTQSVLYKSQDDGESWERIVVSTVAPNPFPDPAFAIDNAGNLYYGFVTADGRLLLLHSTDQGATWSEPVQASPPGVTAHLPAFAAGDPGRLVISFAGTENLTAGYSSPAAEQDAALWNGYLTLTTTALAADPLFQTVRVNEANDPLYRGRCGPSRCEPGMMDFIDVAIGPDGRPYASFADVCIDECIAGGPNNASRSMLATLLEGPLLLEGLE